MDRLIVVDSLEQDISYVLSKIVGVTLHVRKQRIEIHQCGCLESIEIDYIVALERKRPKSNRYLTIPLICSVE
ncbi:hypothetical protein C492_09065 [Natronococcus jeotgali DSM 18795]|uniref:Uncharacterized protein n=1 Tax=Natronococcus jeotgali DSM 18795 TaxID=1227498 RepID=L9XJA7_9EURY|nr:hypothetical protein C492_09065 [Natronococcus jeotgali DSM 18795]